MSQVVRAAPSVPEMNSGVARRVAVAPKVLVKRAIFVGKIEDVPKPAIDAPSARMPSVFPESKTITPSVVVKRPSRSIRFSLRKRAKSGAANRPKTKNKK